MRTEMSELRAELDRRFDQQLRWLGRTVIALGAIMIAAGAGTADSQVPRRTADRDYYTSAIARHD